MTSRHVIHCPKKCDSNRKFKVDPSPMGQKFLKNYPINCVHCSELLDYGTQEAHLPACKDFSDGNVITNVPCHPTCPLYRLPAKKRGVCSNIPAHQNAKKEGVF